MKIAVSLNFIFLTTELVKVAVPERKQEIKEELIQGLSEMLLRSEQKPPVEETNKVDAIRALIAQKLKEKQI